jgi:hypothetical protein
LRCRIINRYADVRIGTRLGKKTKYKQAKINHLDQQNFFWPNDRQRISFFSFSLLPL